MLCETEGEVRGEDYRRGGKPKRRARERGAREDSARAGLLRC